jgi:hypothetical protein
MNGETTIGPPSHAFWLLTTLKYCEVVHTDAIEGRHKGDSRMNGSGASAAREACLAFSRCAGRDYGRRQSVSRLPQPALTHTGS